MSELNSFVEVSLYERTTPLSFSLRKFVLLGGRNIPWSGIIQVGRINELIKMYNVLLRSYFVSKLMILPRYAWRDTELF